MNDEIVIRIPYRVLRELIATQDAASDIPPESTSPDEQRAWTDKQKRFIYRLLQQLDHEGEAAKNYIRSTLRLNGAPPTRSQASQLIDRLQDELSRNDNGARRGAA